MSLVTTEPAPITAPSPMVTPGVTVEFDPIHTSLPMTTGAGSRSARRAGSIAWFSVAMTVLCPMSAPSPIVRPPWSWNRHPELMKTFLPNRILRPKSLVNGGNRPTVASTP